jgi:hypothetical protein
MALPPLRNRTGHQGPLSSCLDFIVSREQSSPRPSQASSLLTHEQWTALIFDSFSHADFWWISVWFVAGGFPVSILSRRFKGSNFPSLN